MSRHSFVWKGVTNSISQIVAVTQRASILKGSNVRKSEEKGFQVLALHHAEAIPKHDMADAVIDHWRKLEDRVRRGVGNPFPLLLIGIPKQVALV